MHLLTILLHATLASALALPIIPTPPADRRSMLERSPSVDKDIPGVGAVDDVPGVGKTETVKILGLGKRSGEDTSEEVQVDNYPSTDWKVKRGVGKRSSEDITEEDGADNYPSTDWK